MGNREYQFEKGKETMDDDDKIAFNSLISAIKELTTVFIHTIMPPFSKCMHTNSWVGVENQGKLIRVAAFPIGVDSERFTKALELPKVEAHVILLEETIVGRKIKSLQAKFMRSWDA